MGIEAAVVFGPRVYDLFHSTTIETTLPLLLTGPVLLINAYFNPGGSAELGMQKRDDWLRRVAKRRGIQVPALMSDPGTTAETIPMPSTLGPAPAADTALAGVASTADPGPWQHPPSSHGAAVP
jgi:hypothetical protein